MVCLLAFGNHSLGQSQMNSVFSNSIAQSVQKNRSQISVDLKYAESIFEDSLSQALQIIEENLEYSIQEGYKIEQAQSYFILGKFNEQLQNQSIAITNFKKARGIYKELGETSLEYELHHRIASLERSLNNNDAAIANHERALLLALKMKSKTKEINSTLLLGDLYLEKKKLKKAESYYKEALKKSEKSNKTSFIVQAKIGLGKIAEQKGENATAEKYYTEAQSLAEKNKLDDLANTSFYQLSEMYVNQNDISNNLEIQQQAYQYNQVNGNSNSILNTSVNLSQTYLEQGNNYEALKILNENSVHLNDEGNSDIKRDFIKTLSDVYDEEGLDQLAKFEAGRYQELVDSFNMNKQLKDEQLAQKNEFLMNTENKMLLMEKDREVNQKMIDVLQKEKELNNDTIKRQRNITIGLIAGFSLVAIMAFLLFRNSKQKQKANQLLVLKSLRSQMNPHFIFNSLNSVNSFISKQDERSANKYLAEFSKLMREVLECSQQDFISLSKEIEILRLYLNLEHFRFNSHFDFSFEIDPAIQTEEFQIPPMLLQPFIENAIWHGLRYKKEKGQLDVSFKQKENHIEIVISDNGIGRENSKKTKTLNQMKMKSTGIANVKNRLEIINDVFKKNLEISIEDMDKQSGEGTIVQLKLY
jgi:two-component system, LytTR family, sensor kinase